MSSCFDKLENVFQHSLTNLKEYNRGCDIQYAENLRMMAARLYSPSSPILQQQPPTNRWPPTSPRQWLLKAAPSLAGHGYSRNHQMILKQHSIQWLWNEWYGLEDCKDKPVAAEIAAMERHQKSKWQKHFSPSKKIALFPVADCNLVVEYSLRGFMLPRSN
jgi:hypothetical protein